jgi:exopolysaccharide biosynthesis polyprenyl glycosylphosphotransferase
MNSHPFLHADVMWVLIALCALGLLLLIRLLLRAAGRARGERVLLYGSGPLGRRLATEIEAHPELGWSLRHVPDAAAGDSAGLLAAAAGGVDRIIVATADRRSRLPVRTLLELRDHGVRIEEAGAVYERLTGKVPLDALRPGDVLFGDGFHISWGQRATARLLSLVAAAVGLVVCAPLLPLLALAIRLEGPGPVLFRQQRIGLQGRPFALLKLRTMRPGPTGSEWERDNIARLTRVGRWLRRYHLDELPQLWNILRGDMNLVGPRPHPLVNAEMFHRRIPHYELRSLVRPGLTGWAQVRYRYANNLEEETEKMGYDLYYIRHRSLWLDLCVLPATVIAAFTNHGPARRTLPRRYPDAVPTPVVDQRSGRQ